MNSITFSTISGAIGVVVPCLILFGCVWILFRTQSRHVLMYRLWRLVHGSQNISDPEVNAYVNEQTSLMWFRFMSGVPVKTLDSARQLIQWTRLHDVEMRVVAMCGDYFDPDLRKVRLDKLPSTLMQKAKAVLITLLSLASFSCFFLAQPDDALVRLKATDHWLLLHGDEAKVLFPIDASPIRKADCSADTNANAVRTNFSAAEVKVLCDLLNNADTALFVDRTVKKQKLSFAILCASLLFWTLIFFAAWMKGYVALGLAQRGLESSLNGNQLELDFNGAATPSRP